MKHLFSLSLLLLTACSTPAMERVPSDLRSGNVFQDSRDGTKYTVRRVGSLDWLEQNAKFRLPGSRCYKDTEALCARLGRLYTLEQAQAACDRANGWRLATDNDWKNLETALGLPERDLNQDRYMGKRGTLEGKRLKTDPAFGMGEFTGYFQGGKYAGRDESEADPSSFDRTYFWAPSESSTVFRRNIRKNTDMIHRFSNPAAGFWNAVRCVRDAAS